MSASSSSASIEDNIKSISTSVSCQSDSDSSGEYHKLLPLDKAKSEVWKHFDFPAKDGQFIEKDKRIWMIIYCKLCPKKLHHQGSTTNMLVHLEYNHCAEYLKIKPGIQKLIPRKATDPNQPLIGDSFEKPQPLLRSSAKWKMLTSSVCHYLAKDMMS